MILDLGRFVAREQQGWSELEVLLKGLACFANPRNHAGPPRRTAIVAQDYREALVLSRDAAHLWTWLGPDPSSPDAQAAVTIVLGAREP